MQRSLFQVCLIVVIAFYGVSVSVAQEVASADENAIREVMQKYAQGFKLPNDREMIYGEILSDTGWVSVAPNPKHRGRARVFNKQTALEFMKTWPKMENYEYLTQTIQVFGSLAYEVGANTQTLPDGKKTNKMEKIHFLVREDTGWKLMFHAPAGPVRQTLQMKPKGWDQYEEFSQIERNNAEDEAAIRALIAKAVSARYLDTPSEVLREILSDNGFSCAMPRPGDPARALIFNKEAICRYQDDIAPYAKSQQYSQQIDSLQIWGPLAYLYQTLTITVSNGREVKQERLVFFAKEPDGWKLIYTADAAHVRKALQAVESSDEVAIREVMNKYEQGWKQPNAQEIYQEILSDTSLVSARVDPQNPSLAKVMNKQAALELLKTLPKLPEYDFQIRAIQIAGALAYVVGVDTMKAPDGSDFKMETIHFLAKESAGWKVLFGTLAGPVRQSFGMKPMPHDRYAEYFKSPQDKSQDETAIRALIAKIESACEMDTPSKVLQDVISDRAFAYVLTLPDDPSRLLLFTKDAYCKFRDDRTQVFRNNAYSHKINAIQIYGPLACQYGTLTIQTNSGSEIKQELLGFYAKEQKGWKLIFGAEAPNVRNVLQDADKKKPTMSDDEKNLRRISQRFVDVFSLENPTPFEWLEEILTDDFFVVCSDGRLLPDKQTTLQEYRKVLDAIRKSASSMKMNFDIHSVRVFKETACVFGKIRMEGQAKKSGEEFQRDIWETLLFRKVNGHWKIGQEHSTVADADISG